MKLRLTVFGLLAVFLGLPGVSCAHAEAPPPLADDGSPCVADRAALMARDYWAFDQEAEGIRAVMAKPGCGLVAADLYRDYHAALRARGAPVMITLPNGEAWAMSETGEISILYWHEGQLRAFAGDGEGAVSLFEQSLNTPEASHYGWEEYVRGSVAFLRGDLDTLKAAREAMEGKVSPGMDDINLGVLDGLIACFGRSYSDAYGAPECNRRPGAAP